MAPAADARKKVVTIEFVEDGLTAFGTVWSKGERKSITKDSREWATTVNRRNEDSWLLLSNKGQMERWGKIYFRRIAGVDVTVDSDSKGEQKDG